MPNQVEISQNIEAHISRIKESLLKEAEEEVQKIISEAEKEAKEQLEEARRRIEEEYRKKLNSAKEEAQKFVESRLTAVKLDLKKEELAKKQRILSEVFEKIEEELRNSPIENLARLYELLLEKSGLKENEESILTVSKDMEKLAKTLKEKFSSLKIEVESKPHLKGFVKLKSGSMETELSLSSIVSSFREKFEGSIAKELF